MIYCPSCYSENLKRDGKRPGTGAQRYTCKSCGYGTVEPLGLDRLEPVIGVADRFDRRTRLNRADRIVVTSAQNATPIMGEFFESLKQYCEHKNAELVCLPYRYRNPTSIFSEEDEWWDGRLVPYMYDQRYTVQDNLVLLSDTKPQATAVNPLSGFEGFTGEASCIVPHPKIEFRSVPTRQGKMAKIMTTTGACTVPNYTQSKAGAKGNHHHSIGAVVIEKDGEYFHTRHLLADESGGFYDLDKYYSQNGVRAAERAPALVLGDCHHRWLNKDAEAAVFGSGGIVDTVQPERLVLHDLVDSYAISHHHRGDPFTQIAKHSGKCNDAYQEIKDACDWVDSKITDEEVVVVNSNHDHHLARWVNEADWRNDPVNAEFYLQTALYMVRNTGLDGCGANIPNPFKYWVDSLTSDQVTVLQEDQSYMVEDIELGLHGDKGPNGARGSPQSLSKIGVKAIVGHYHSPQIKDGLYAVGTLTNQMSYAKGPSSWLHTCCIIYPNNKRTLVNIMNGGWKSE